MSEDTEKSFKPFSKIMRIDNITMSITQKIHGTNAQIFIDNEKNIYVSSRNRLLSVYDDNVGFCRFVIYNKDYLIEHLGVGRHYGEWAGKGINNGEGLSINKLFLFNWKRFINNGLEDIEKHPQIGFVPVLYNGGLDLEKIEQTMTSLKENGSYISPGFMKPEGIVIDINGTLYKKTFDQEDIAWKGEKDRKEVVSLPDISNLLQPLRLEKLLSRDEKYRREYPQSLSSICSDYIKDLQEEGFFPYDKDESKLIRKSLGKSLFYFIKSYIN